MSNIDETQTVFNDVYQELKAAIQNFDSFHNSHEGYAVLKEEIDELWDAIKDKKQNVADERREAIQVAAMAIRFILDVCTGKGL